MALELEDLKEEFGHYYLNNGQNLARLYSTLFTPAETELILTSVITDDEIWRGSRTRITSLLQPFQKAWTPKGNIGFDPLTIRQFKQKADLDIDPDDIESTWLGFLRDESLDRSEWPLIRYVIEKKMLPKIAEDYEREAIFWGIRKEPPVGVAGDAHMSMDGLRYIRNKAIKEGRINPIIVGAPPTDPKEFYQYLEDMIDLIEDLYQDEPMKLAMSKELMKRGKRGKRALYGKDNDFNDENQNEIMYSRTSMNGLFSHRSSEIIWCTPAYNGVKLSKGADHTRLPRLETSKRNVSIFTDFWKGAGWVLPELVFTNDVEFGQPIINSLSTEVIAEAGGTEVTIMGRDLRYITSAKFGATDATEIEVVSDKSIKLTSPALGSGDYPITLVNEFGTTISVDEVSVPV